MTALPNTSTTPQPTYIPQSERVLVTSERQTETETRRKAHEEFLRGLQMVCSGFGMMAAAYARLYLGRV